MNFNLKGNKYKFIIQFQKENSDKGYFTVYAVCKKSGRYSTVNNLNFILSIFDIDSDNPHISESSDWFLSDKEFKSYFEIFNSIIGDNESLKMFEKRLVEDRLEGEWENVIQ